jgi:predicted Zn finger-like uncharacterized protein
MIVACVCGAKLRVSEERIGAYGVKVRCPRCAAVQLVQRPESSPEAPPGELSVPAQPTTVEEPSGHASTLPSSASSECVTPVLHKALVLVAHDTKVVADMIEGILKKAGMTMAYARNGLEALKKATSLKPQAMIVDVGLTGIFGFELCERLKGDPDTAGIKIILLSSVYGLTAYKREPVTLYGADDYIEKHHIPDELVPKLVRLLSPERPPIKQPAPSPPEPAPGTPPFRSTDSTGPSAPLISRKGILQSPVSRPDSGVSVPERSLEQEGSSWPWAARAADIGEPAEAPSEGTDTPIARDRETKSPEAPYAMEPPAPAPETPGVDASALELPVQDAPMQAPPSVPDSSTLIPEAETTVSVSERTTESGEGVAGTMAEFFEQHEYAEPSATSAAAPIDPQEIDKARRFARLIVSDIVLYNEDAVAEGIREGTFYEILREDISEGRSLYEKRVPEAIRATMDYLQEAFDNFLVSKKKPR